MVSMLARDILWETATARRGFVTAQHAAEGVKPEAKEPVSANVVNAWITQAERQLGDEAKGGRLGWLIASSVAVAAVQRALDEDGRQLFLLKGGTLLQHRLNGTACTTKEGVRECRVFG